MTVPAHTRAARHGYRTSSPEEEHVDDVPDPGARALKLVRNGALAAAIGGVVLGGAGHFLAPSTTWGAVAMGIMVGLVLGVAYSD